MASVVAQHTGGNINCMDIQVLCICNRNKECCALESWFIKIVDSGMNRDQGILSSDHDRLPGQETKNNNSNNNNR